MLQKLLEKINFKYVSVIICLLALSYFAYYYYKNYVLKKINPEFVENKEFVSELDDSDLKNHVNIYFFSVDWCPYCANLKKSLTWEKFVKKYENKRINKKKINFKKVDCSMLDSLDDDIPYKKRNCSNLTKYEKPLINGNNPIVEGYPTVVLVDGVYEEGIHSNVFILGSQITDTNLSNFIENVFK